MSAMREIRESVGRYAAGFDAALVSGADAEVILADAIAAENMLAAIRSLVAARVAECASWKREGDGSAAHQLARKAGIPLGRAQEALSTAERLASQPEPPGLPARPAPTPRAASRFWGNPATPHVARLPQKPAPAPAREIPSTFIAARRRQTCAKAPAPWRRRCLTPSTWADRRCPARSS